MNLLKLLAKVALLIIFIIFLNNPNLGFYSFQWKISFALFLIVLLIDAIQINYFSFVLSLFGVILFNPFKSLEIPYTSYVEIIRWSILFINIWIILDINYLINRLNKKPGTRILDYIKLNEETGKYEIFDGVYKYEICTELIDNLKRYMNSSAIKIMGDWYNRLSEDDRKKVRKTSKFAESRK